MSNMPRRGNQPIAEQLRRGRSGRGSRAPRTSSARTMHALMRIEMSAAPRKTTRTMRSRRRRRAAAAQRDARRQRRASACAMRSLRTAARCWAMGIANGPGLRAGPAGPWRRRLLGGVPGGARRGELVGRQVHVADGLEDRGDGAVGEVVVDEGDDRRVRGGLGLVDVDVQVARERVAAVGDGLGGRRDARRRSAPWRPRARLTLSRVLLGEGEADPAERGVGCRRCPR